MEDILFCRQSINYYIRSIVQKRADQLILQTGCKDGGPFSQILILKWSFSHLQKLVIASLRIEVEVKNTLCNAIRDLPVTLGEIKGKAFDDDFIKEIKNKKK